MRAFKCTYLGPVTLFLTIVILFQCCKAYYIEPVSIEQAIGSDKKKVKIITIDDRTLYFDSLYFKNDKLYGLMNKNKNLKKKTEVNIPIESIKSIHLLNIKQSRSKTALAIIGVSIGIIAAIFIIGAISISTTGF
jgi:hypothetical protein